MSEASTGHKDWYTKPLGHTIPSAWISPMSNRGDISLSHSPNSIDAPLIEMRECASQNAPTKSQHQQQLDCSCKACTAVSPGRPCLCLACTFPTLRIVWHEATCCRFTACGEKVTRGGPYEIESRHERSHFGKPGNYRCHEKYCPLANKAFKRWADLKRHSKVAHCKIAPLFTCDILGCKYRERGFSRKDKLTSHIKNVHAGKAAPGTGLRNLQPAT